MSEILPCPLCGSTDLMHGTANKEPAIGCCECTCRALESHWQKRAAMPGWQPIESAPKDGTTVLGYWCNGEQHTGSTDGNDWFPAWEHDGESWVLPTHWMHLPEAPK